MLSIIVLVCILASLLAAVILMSWINSKRGKGEKAARLYSILKNRNANFRRFQYLPAIATAIILTAATGMGTNWINAAAYAIGAVVCFALVLLTACIGPTGTLSAACSAVDGDINTSVRASYRTGAAMGFFVAATAVLMFGAAYMLGHKYEIISCSGAIISFALGASTQALFLHSGGSVYSTAYSLAVNDDDFTDNTGFISGISANMLESMIMSAAAAVLLSDVAVATSGIESSFTNENAEMFPMMILACGAVASIIGTLVFRVGKANNLSGSATISCIISGVLTAAATFYFSTTMLQSMVYAYATGTGIIAGLIIGEISKFFASDSKIHIANKKADKRLGTHVPVIVNLGTGMFSSSLYIILIIAAISVAFNFASFYGIALCGVGMCAIAPAIAAISGLGVVSGTTSEIIMTRFGGKEFSEVSDALETASIRSGISARSYGICAAVFSCFGMLTAIAYSSNVEAISIVNIKTLTGLLGGVVSIPVLLGLLIWSVRTTGTVAVKVMGHNDEEGATDSLIGSVLPSILSMAIPAVTGLFFGLDVLIAFLSGAIASGCVFMYMINNAGRYFEKTSIQSIETLLKMMLIFTAVFVPAFMKIGGFIF